MTLIGTSTLANGYGNVQRELWNSAGNRIPGRASTDRTARRCHGRAVPLLAAKRPEQIAVPVVFRSLIIHETGDVRMDRDVARCGLRLQATVIVAHIGGPVSAETMAA
jgi:hypothetical protein